jgi:hypothetical protein
MPMGSVLLQMVVEKYADMYLIYSFCEDHAASTAADMQSFFPDWRFI